MKIRPLPEIDLARIMHRPRLEMRSHLAGIGDGFPPHSYNPTRETIPDLLNQRGDLLSVGALDWETIRKLIAKRVRRGPEELKHNLAVAKLLHDYTIQKKIWSKRHEFFQLKIGLVGGVRYWWDVYYIDDGRAVVPFVDPRLSRGLSAEDRRVVFSFMHERIRVSGSDFEDARLAIIQFPKNAKGQRELRIHYDDGIELYSFEQLSSMIAVLYEEWASVLRDREGERRRASGERGDLL
jgi:hypothetical protein